MKNYFYSIFFLSVISCHENVPEQGLVLKSAQEISIVNGMVYYKRQKFNGIIFELNPNNRDTVLSQSIKKGLLDGVYKKWYPNKQLMEYREFKSGRKNGRQTAFWYNGNKRFDFIAINDAYEGALKEWSVNGKLFHLANYSNGQEEGSQKMWYENGKIRANYVIISGKRYGLLGTKNCKNVSDSIFVVR